MVMIPIQNSEIYCLKLLLTYFDSPLKSHTDHLTEANDSLYECGKTEPVYLLATSQKKNNQCINHDALHQQTPHDDLRDLVE